MAWTVKIPAGSTGGPMYMRLLRRHAQMDTFIPVYESEIVETNPYRWKKFDMPTYLSGSQSLDFPLRFEVYKDGKTPKCIGYIVTDLSEVKFRGTSFKAKTATMEVGISELLIVEQPGFLDYIFGGCEVSLMIGIDFTKSNGPLTDPSSLHYQDPGKGNEYIEAIQAVGDILQYYDSDKKIPVFGFGAKLPPTFTHVSHCFALNGDIFNPEVQGISEVVSVYRKASQQVHFHGPTIFSRIIQMTAECAKRAEVSQDTQRYFLLLIITDGIINDMEATVHEIVEASRLPLSIIIVGVGNEDFTMMKELDSDERKLVSRVSRRAMERDIVQFVPYRQLKDNHLNLAREVLYEVPSQLVSYMTLHGIKPGFPKGQQLFMDSKLNSHRGLPPVTSKYNPFESLKEQFVLEMTAAGLDSAAVKDLVEDGLLASELPYINELLDMRPRVVSSRTVPALKPTLRKEKRSTTQGKSVRIEPEKRLCKVCYDKNIDTVLLECGHRVICHTCMETLNEKVCPCCRQPISRWVRTYDS